MTTVKIAVSLPEPLVSRARRSVRRGEASSVSAYIAGAIQQRAQQEDLESLLREMLVESGGPLTATERRSADAALGLGTSARPRRAKRV
jgi:Arc/MetJ-type ribon-helix-helix transcriptional regulator